MPLFPVNPYKKIAQTSTLGIKNAYLASYKRKAWTDSMVQSTASNTLEKFIIINEKTSKTTKFIRMKILFHIKIFSQM